MKCIRFFAAIFAAALAFSFFSCSDDEEDFADALVWYRNDDSGYGQITLAFYDDNTFVLHQKQELEEKNADGKKVINNYDIATGTYTGDPTQNGTVSVTYKKTADMNRLKPLGFLWFGEKTETVNNDTYPLVALENDVSKSYEISEETIKYEEILEIPLKLNKGQTELELKKGESGI